MMCTSPAISSEKGFTLLEVMVAVAILAIVFVSLLQLVVRGITFADYDKTITKATLFAREKMSEGLSGGSIEINVEGSGEDEYEDFTWERSLTPTIFKGISQMKVTVKWVDGEDESELSLTQFVFDG